MTLEPKSNEAHAFGTATNLVQERRQLRTGITETGTKPERARAEEHRWELELAMIEEFGLTLPPETEPLPQSRKSDHFGWRRTALEQVRQERARWEKLRILRRVLTLGPWWR